MPSILIRSLIKCARLAVAIRSRMRCKSPSSGSKARSARLVRLQPLPQHLELLLVRSDQGSLARRQLGKGPSYEGELDTRRKCRAWTSSDVSVIEEVRQPRPHPGRRIPFLVLSRREHGRILHTFRKSHTLVLTGRPHRILGASSGETAAHLELCLIQGCRTPWTAQLAEHSPCGLHLSPDPC